MSHLSTDRLAALGDEEPTAAEAAHLAACATCASERTAYRTLVGMAHGERDAMGLPLTRWDAIASALGAGSSGAIGVPLSGAARSSGARGVARAPLLRAAAAVLLLAGGAVVGRRSAGAPLLPDLASTGQNAAAFDSAGGRSGAFTSVEQARLAQLRSEAVYQQATAFLAEHDTAALADGSPTAYRSRLAALDQVISTTRAAMRQAPHDPVINGYYLTTIGQREATLRQLNTVLPASLRSNSF
ncbi:MAG TPA: hypothetical protein VFP90_16180 [Gemmatimonadaceae bacterium]|nr:hypothetical protein [Gemmatimonadaceae bacterium]